MDKIQKNSSFFFGKPSLIHRSRFGQLVPLTNKLLPKCPFDVHLCMVREELKSHLMAILVDTITATHMTELRVILYFEANKNTLQEYL